MLMARVRPRFNSELTFSDAIQYNVKLIHSKPKKLRDLLIEYLCIHEVYLHLLICLGIYANASWWNFREIYHLETYKHTK